MDFDLNKLKKRSPYPIETIAVGLAFSPRIEAIIAEAKSLSDTLGSQLLLIHVKEKTKKKEKLLENIFFKINIDRKKIKIIWAEGDVVDTILKLCKLNIVDLLVIGALERENILKYYLGSIARTISRKAKCSVLLLTNPSVTLKQKQKIIVHAITEHPKTVHTINTAIYFAKKFGITEISLVHEVHVPALSMTMSESSNASEVSRIKKELLEEESNKLHSLISKCDIGTMKIHENMIKGKPGYAIQQYAENKKADLLVINSLDMHLTLLDRIFTHDIEYILADLSCNLLIVHSRV
ncbi:MAG: universal stress protein [Bacteroidota bacterium]